jgi:hypothetical protein
VKSEKNKSNSRRWTFAGRHPVQLSATKGDWENQDPRATEKDELRKRTGSDAGIKDRGAAGNAAVKEQQDKQVHLSQLLAVEIVRADLSRLIRNYSL